MPFVGTTNRMCNRLPTTLVHRNLLYIFPVNQMYTYNNIMILFTLYVSLYKYNIMRCILQENTSWVRD